MDNGRKDLSKKVKNVGNLSMGYDIISFELDGRKKYIEVKSTTTENKTFYLTKNEYEKSKKLGNYYVYIVRYYKNLDPSRIEYLKHPNFDNSKNYILQPTQYKVYYG